MKDHQEKYLKLSQDFSNKAGWLMQMYEQQIRLCHRLSREKTTDEHKKLILSCLETHQVARDLCNYTHSFLQEVLTDLQFYSVKARNTIEMQSELIDELLTLKNDITRKDKTTA